MSQYNTLYMYVHTPRYEGLSSNYTVANYRPRIIRLQTTRSSFQLSQYPHTHVPIG